MKHKREKMAGVTMTLLHPLRIHLYVYILSIGLPNNGLFLP